MVGWLSFLKCGSISPYAGNRDRQLECRNHGPATFRTWSGTRTLIARPRAGACHCRRRLRGSQRTQSSSSVRTTVMIAGDDHDDDWQVVKPVARQDEQRRADAEDEVAEEQERLAQDGDEDAHH